MRPDQQRLNDILDALDWIARATAERTEDGFVADETLFQADVQRLTIIGEEAAMLSQESRARRDSAAWADM
jgi:uncharacterized protein with HEPN domain